MAESKSKKAEGLTYKGHPLRRVDNLIYYGTMAEKYIIMMQILNTKKEQDMEVATKVSIQLQLTDPELKSRDRVVKKSEKDSHRLAGSCSCWQAVRNRTFSPRYKRLTKGTYTYDALRRQSRQGPVPLRSHRNATGGHRPGSGHRHRRRLHHRFFPAAAGRALYLRLRGHHAGQECGGGDLG